MVSSAANDFECFNLLRITEFAYLQYKLFMSTTHPNLISLRAPLEWLQFHDYIYENPHYRLYKIIISHVTV